MFPSRTATWQYREYPRRLRWPPDTHGGNPACGVAVEADPDIDSFFDPTNEFAGGPGHDQPGHVLDADGIAVEGCQSSFAISINIFVLWTGLS